MKAMSVGKIKAQFSEVLERVQHGESFGVLYGRKKRPVAMIVPYVASRETAERRLGVLDGKVQITFADDFKITEEEFVGLKRNAH